MTSTLDAAAAQYGAVLNTWRALLHRPTIFEAYLPYLRSVVGPGVLDQRIKNLAALSVALVNHCRYSASHRVHAGRAAGLSDEELDALAEGRYAEFNASEQLAIELARQLSLAPPQVSHDENPVAVDADLLDRLRSTFEEAQIVELLCVVSIWNALTRFHRVMDLPLDMPPPPPSFERALAREPNATIARK